MNRVSRPEPKTEFDFHSRYAAASQFRCISCDQPLFIMGTPQPYRIDEAATPPEGESHRDYHIDLERLEGGFALMKSFTAVTTASLRVMSVLSAIF